MVVFPRQLGQFFLKKILNLTLNLKKKILW